MLSWCIMTHPGPLTEPSARRLSPLGELAPLPASAAAGLVAALATTVADLHDLGAPLGGFTIDDVLVDDDGRPLLRPEPGSSDPPSSDSTPASASASTSIDAEPAVADVRALGRLISDLLPAAGRLPRAVSFLRGGLRAEPGAHRDPSQVALVPIARWAMAATEAGPSARALADAITSRVPQAQLPDLAASTAGTTSTAPDRSRVRRHPHPDGGGQARRAAGWVVFGLAVVVFLLVVVTTTRHGRRPAAPIMASATSGPTPSTAPALATTVPATTVTPPRPCPALAVAMRADVDGDGCDDALTYAGGVLSSAAIRFAVGTAGDRAAVGRWRCRSPSTLALLEPSGEVYVADGWARPGTDVALRLVATIPGATELRSVDPDGDGCDELLVERAGGSTTTVRPDGP
jgi:hypothetical protein